MRWNSARKRRAKPIQPHAEEKPKPVKIERPPPEPPRCPTCQKRVVWLRVDGGIAAFDPHTVERAIARRRLRHLGLPIEMIGGRLHAKSCRRRPVAPTEEIYLTDAWGLPWWPIPRKGKPVHLDPIYDRLVLVLDTETTGPDPETARIVELGAVYFWRGQMVGRPLNIRLNPGCPIPPEASAVHGITDADVAGAPTFADVALRLLAHITGQWAAEQNNGAGLVKDGRQGQPPLVVGYNILRFDAPLIDAEFKRVAELIRFRPEAPMAQADIIDPYVFARWHPPDKPGKLTDLCDAFGITLDSAHAAWADAEATGRLLYRLLDTAENQRPPVPGFIPASIADPPGTSGLFYDPPGLDSPCVIGRQAAIAERIAAERAEFGHYFYRDRQRPEGIIRIGFGKHKGASVNSVPASYWSYFLRSFGDLHEGAERLMRQMGGKGEYRPPAKPIAAEPPLPAPTTPAPEPTPAATTTTTTATTGPLEDSPW